MQYWSNMSSNAGMYRKEPQQPVITWSMFNNRDNSDKYTITLRNKFDTLQEISETLTLNDEYENFINVHMEVAAECIPTKLKAKNRVPWETLAVKKKRDDVKTGSLCRKGTQLMPMLRNLRWDKVNAYLKE